MANFAGPTNILINSHSAYGFHKSQLNALEWSASPDVGGAGSVNTHDSSTIDVDAMVLALVAKFQPFFPTTYHWDNYIVFTSIDDTTPPVPVASGTIDLAGTSATPGWSKAVQMTLSFRTEGFGIAKLVFLDVDSTDAFDKTIVVPPATPLEALVNEFTDESNGWCGRDNARPDVYLSTAVTLNEKLRREYRMT